MPEPLGRVFPRQPRPRRPSASAALGQVMFWLIPLGIVVGLIVAGVAVWRSYFSGPETNTLVAKEVMVGPGQAESGSFSAEIYCRYRLTVTARDGHVGMIVDDIAGQEPTAAERALMMKKASTYPAGEPLRVGGHAEPGKHYAWIVFNAGQKPLRALIELRLHRD